MSDKLFYKSSNGDRWFLAYREQMVRPYVLHVGNAPSGGARTELDVETFLARGSGGPEHQALRELLATPPPLKENAGKAGITFIRHTVAFSLKHAKGSSEEAAFLADALVLADIPGVLHFERLVQTSPKNDFEFGFSMEFGDQAAFDAYNSHPDHVAFVRDRWVPEIERFLETDYRPF